LSDHRTGAPIPWRVEGEFSAENTSDLMRVLRPKK
jgi:hypothetical protein